MRDNLFAQFRKNPSDAPVTSQQSFSFSERDIFAEMPTENSGSEIYYSPATIDDLYLPSASYYECSTQLRHTPPMPIAGASPGNKYRGSEDRRNANNADKTERRQKHDTRAEIVNPLLPPTNNNNFIDIAEDGKNPFSKVSCTPRNQGPAGTFVERIQARKAAWKAKEAKIYLKSDPKKIAEEAPIRVVGFQIPTEENVRGR